MQSVGWTLWLAMSVFVLVACMRLDVNSARTDHRVSTLGGAVLVGAWGGEHIRLVVTTTGATVEYDCAFGKIEAPLLPDQEGNFEARGVHVFERGGPAQLGEPALRQHPAQYHGWTNGSHMRLTVTLLETGTHIGTFALDLGRQPLLVKCL